MSSKRSQTKHHSGCADNHNDNNMDNGSRGGYVINGGCSANHNDSDSSATGNDSMEQWETTTQYLMRSAIEYDYDIYGPDSTCDGPDLTLDGPDSTYDGPDLTSDVENDRLTDSDDEYDYLDKLLGYSQI